MKVLVFALLFTMFGLTAVAQRLCGTDSYIKNYFRELPAVASFVETLPPRDTSLDEIITIPVVIHVMFNAAGQNISDAQVLSQIAVLNNDFRLLNADKNSVPSVFKKYAADAKIMFCLAKVDPDGRPTSGIDRKYSSKEFFMSDDGMKFKAMGGANAWDSKRYLNIWVCNLFGRTLGYATPPGGPEDKDGVVIKFDVFGNEGTLQAGFNKGRTATHEVAHWLGLKHIWGDEDCGDDEVDDTPRQKSYNFGCPSFPVTSTCSTNIYGDMFMNFMDLTDDGCMSLFTIGQKNRMRSLFALGAKRNSLLRSYQCDSSLASGGPLPQDTLPVAAKAVVIKLYPNPVVADLHIETDDLSAITGKTATLYSSNGMLLKKFILLSDKTIISLQQFAAGMYILKIGEAGDQKSYKIIKI